MEYCQIIIIYCNCICLIYYNRLMDFFHKITAGVFKSEDTFRTSTEIKINNLEESKENCDFDLKKSFDNARPESLIKTDNTISKDEKLNDPDLFQSYSESIQKLKEDNLSNITCNTNEKVDVLEKIDLGKMNKKLNLKEVKENARLMDAEEISDYYESQFKTEENSYSINF